MYKSFVRFFRKSRNNSVSYSRNSQSERLLSVENLESRELLSICTWVGNHISNDQKYYWNYYDNIGGQKHTNWQNNATPAAGDELDFTSNGPKTCVADSSLTAGKIAFSASGYDIQGTVYVGNSGGNASVITNGTTNTIENLNTGYYQVTIPHAGLTINSLSGGNELTLNSAVTINSGSFSGVIDGSGGITKTGTSWLTLSPPTSPSVLNNTYSGGTTVSDGVLQVSRPGALANYGSSQKVTVNGGILQLYVGGPSETVDWQASNINALLSMGSFTSGTLDLDAWNGNFSYGGIPSRPIGLYVRSYNSNVLTLTGTNSYTGNTTIIGNLSIDSSSRLGGDANHGVVLQSGTLQVTNSGTFNKAISLSSSGGGKIDTYGAGTSVNISSIISGSGALTKIGDGTLTLSGTNNYSGGTTINAGIVSIAAASNLAAC